MYSSPRAFHETLQPGVSLAGIGCGRGTLGAWVRNSQGNLRLLSAWHVLLGPYGVIGQAVLQPSPADGGATPKYAVGVTTTFVRDRSGEAALARPIGSRKKSNRVLGAGVILKGARDPVEGDVLEQVVAGTGHTRAEVMSVGEVKTTYVPGGCRGLVLGPVGESAREISAPGDSGAVWYDPLTGFAVGLHLEGELTGKDRAIACCITDVLRALKATL